MTVEDRVTELETKLRNHAELQEKYKDAYAWTVALSEVVPDLALLVMQAGVEHQDFKRKLMDRVAEVRKDLRDLHP